MTNFFDKGFIPIPSNYEIFFCSQNFQFGKNMKISVYYKLSDWNLWYSHEHNSEQYI